MSYKLYVIFFFFFFSSRRRHTRFDCDWSSDVCSSDLVEVEGQFGRQMDGDLTRAAAQVPFACRLALGADVTASGFQAQGAAHVAEVRVTRACLDLHAVGGDSLKLRVAAARPHADIAADGPEVHVA